MAIYVATHKAFKEPRRAFYRPIQVGDGPSLGFLRDDTGDNIANKNKSFCELTALYWAWKNDRDSEILGLCHYRRFFADEAGAKTYRHLLTQERAEERLATADLILPEQWHWDMSVEEFYSHCAGLAQDFQLVRETVAAIHPAYRTAFEAVAKGSSASYCNMMVARKDVFAAYCEWLFGILFQIEPQVDLEGRSPSEVRVFGYLGEILLNVWVRANDMAVAEVPMARIDSGQKGRLGSLAGRLRERIAR